MSEIQAQTLADVRQLFEVFMRSPWRQIDLRYDQVELSITRFGRAERTPGSEGLASGMGSGAASDCEILRSPHVATLVSLAPVGVVVQPGDRYATIRVLDEHMELKAEGAFKVVAHAARPGDLLDYFSPTIEVGPISI